MEASEIKKLKVAKVKCLTSTLFFTRYFFKARFNRKFVIGEHHELISQTLDKVYRGEITRLIINIAPRYGKTELAVKNFIANGLALNPAAKFIHLSYSDDLALDNSEDTKNIVQCPEYQVLFPEVEIKKDSKAKKKWYTTKGGGVYATSTKGQVTGFGAGQVDDEEYEDFAEFTDYDAKAGFGGALVIDDPIKPEDADSEIMRERINLRFDSTLSNRVNSRNTPIVIIMQRLHERDLCGYIMGNERDQWTVLSLPSIKPDGTALWTFKHSLIELRELERRNPVVFERQHMQNPMPLAGRLYKTFKTYDVLPMLAKSVKCVIDTADTGSDFLCQIIYMPTVVGYYVIDIYYTPDHMEVTEEESARRICRFKVDSCKVESNNGGRGFARNVEKICRAFGNTKTSIHWFHQSKNKDTRIFTNAADVQNMVYYPSDWETRFPEYAKHVKSYMANAKNSNDDAEDCVTMIIEEEGVKGKVMTGSASNETGSPLDWISEAQLTMRPIYEPLSDEDLEEFYK